MVNSRANLIRINVNNTDFIEAESLDNILDFMLNATSLFDPELPEVEKFKTKTSYRTCAHYVRLHFRDIQNISNKLQCRLKSPLLHRAQLLEETTSTRVKLVGI